MTGESVATAFCSSIEGIEPFGEFVIPDNDRDYSHNVVKGRLFKGFASSGIAGHHPAVNSILDVEVVVVRVRGNADGQRRRTSSVRPAS